MTKQFDALQDEPQTKIHRNDLNFEERSLVWKIDIPGNKGRSSGAVGPFTTIYYIEGDEKRAAERFVEENKERIEQIDFSKNQNLLKANADREIYDWILHALGERHLQKLNTVVVEKRSDDTTWVIDREHYESGSARRYAIEGNTGARIQGATLHSLYQQFDNVITESDLRARSAFDGYPEYILKAYRDDPEFECDPVTVDGELAVQKRN